MFEQANRIQFLTSMVTQRTKQVGSSIHSSMESDMDYTPTHVFHTDTDATIPTAVSIDWELGGINKGGHSAPKSSVVPTPDGNLIITGDAGMVYSVTTDRKINWVAGTHPSGQGIHGTPLVVDGTVYIGAYDGALYAFDVKTGERQWRTQFGQEDVPIDTLGAAIGSSPIYHEGTIYVAVEFSSPCPSGGLFAVDATTGAVEHEDRWPSSHPHSTPGIDPETDTIAFGANDGALYAWTFPELERKWSFEIEADDDTNDIKGPISVYDGAFIFGSWNESVYRVDAATGQQQWEFETDGYVMGGSAVDAETGTVYTGSHDNHCYALDAASGDEKWRFESAGWMTGCPTLTPEHVLIGSYDGNVYALDKTDGEEVWYIPNDGWITSKPLVYDDAIYYSERATEERAGRVYRFTAAPFRESSDDSSAES